MDDKAAKKKKPKLKAFTKSSADKLKKDKRTPKADKNAPKDLLTTTTGSDKRDTGVSAFSAPAAATDHDMGFNVQKLNMADFLGG